MGNGKFATQHRRRGDLNCRQHATRYRLSISITTAAVRSGPSSTSRLIFCSFFCSSMVTDVMTNPIASTTPCRIRTHTCGQWRANSRACMLHLGRHLTAQHSCRHSKIAVQTWLHAGRTGRPLSWRTSPISLQISSWPARQQAKRCTIFGAISCWCHAWTKLVLALNLQSGSV